MPMTAAARRRQRDQLRDDRVCPFSIDQQGVRHLVLPTGLVYSATEAKLAELYVATMETPEDRRDERHLAILERMLTPDERAVARDMVDEGRDRQVLLPWDELVGLKKIGEGGR